MLFAVANILAGNPVGTEGLEITLKGPDLRFLAPAVVSVCGAPMEITIDGADVAMWTRLYIRSGQTLSIGKLNGSGGCRGEVLSIVHIHPANLLY
jgi:allophanate hydrolase subunit 2